MRDLTLSFLLRSLTCMRISSSSLISRRCRMTCSWDWSRLSPSMNGAYPENKLHVVQTESIWGWYFLPPPHTIRVGLSGRTTIKKYFFAVSPTYTSTIQIIVSTSKDCVGGLLWRVSNSNQARFLCIMLYVCYSYDSRNRQSIYFLLLRRYCKVCTNYRRLTYRYIIYMK